MKDDHDDKFENLYDQLMTIQEIDSALTLFGKRDEVSQGEAGYGDIVRINNLYKQLL